MQDKIYSSEMVISVSYKGVRLKVSKELYLDNSCDSNVRVNFTKNLPKKVYQELLISDFLKSDLYKECLKKLNGDEVADKISESDILTYEGWSKDYLEMLERNRERERVHHILKKIDR